MKNLSLACFLFMCLQPALAQTEFAPAGAEWFYRATSGYVPEIYAYDGFLYARYTGDTVLDGRTCKVICTALYARENPQPPYCGPQATERYLYQTADSVFEYEPATLNSRLLFRTNYAVGDPVFDIWGMGLTVQSIDTLEFNGRPVRRFWISSNSACYDLFGPAGGLFSDNPWGLVVDAGATELRCYQDAAFPRVNLGISPCDQVIAPDGPRFEVVLLPNPVRDELQIHVQGILPARARFALYDPAGRLVLEDRLVSPLKKVPVSHLAHGLYVCVFRDGDSIFHQKFIKN